MTSILTPTRRLFLSRSSRVTLSATAVGLLAGCAGMARSTQTSSTTASDVGILNVALGLEHEAINAYLGVMASFSDTKLAQVAGRLAADETMHWTAPSQALGRSLPGGPLSFGA